MKGNFSNYSHRPEQRYSGLYLQQGRMVTDADQVELNEIHKSRTDTLGGLTVQSGVPATDGILTFDANDVPVPREGLVVVDGIVGHLTFKEDVTNWQGALAHQSEYPAEQLGWAEGATLYVDLWERPIFPWEDERLVDPGLRGADTAFRTRTVVQLKLAADTKLEEFAPPPAKGNGELTAEKATTTTSDNSCDPCAEEVDLPVRLGNMLVRLEVLAVAGETGSITLGWSTENGSEVWPTDGSVPDAFAHSPGVFEFFTIDTERLKGVDAPGDIDERLSTNLQEGPPEETPQWFVRRWDDVIKVTLGDDPKAISRRDLRGVALDDEGILSLQAGPVALKLHLRDRDLLCGDYWLVRVREHAEEEGQIQVLGERTEDGHLPIGIEHHYLPLGTTTNEGIEAVKSGSPDYRRLSFPPLADLPASHVGYKGRCDDIKPFSLYQDKQVNSVEQALNALCELGANHVAFSAECDRLSGVDNVQAALEALCEIQADSIAFSTKCDRLSGVDNVQAALERLCETDIDLTERNRYLHDWGVLCGLSVRPDGNILTARSLIVGPGSFIDQRGRLVHLREQATVSLPKRSGSLCLAAYQNRDGSVGFEFLAPDQAAGLTTEGVARRAAACERLAGGWGGFRDKFVTEVDRTLIDAFLLQATALGDAKIMARADTVGLTTGLLRQKKNYATINKFLGEVREEIARVDPHGVADIKFELPEWSADRLAETGDRLNRIAHALGAAMRAAQERCRCEALTPDCPPSGELPDPAYVPIAGIEQQIPPRGIRTLQRICTSCCRRYAMTPRLFRHWFEAMITGRQAEAVEMYCNGTGVPSVLRPEPTPAFEPRWTVWPIPEAVDLVKEWRRVQARYPDIIGRSEELARTYLADRAVNVVEVVNLDEPDALLKQVVALGDHGWMETEAPGEVAPGDDVVLLLKGGEVAGVAVAKLGTPTTTRDSAPGLDAAFEKAIREAAEVRAEAIVTERIAQHAEALSKTMEEARLLREQAESEATRAAELVKGVENQTLQLTKLMTQQQEATDTAKKLLAATEAKAKVLAEEPIEAVITNPAIVKTLNNANIRTVKDLGGTDDATLDGLKLERTMTDFLKNVGRVFRH